MALDEATRRRWLDNYDLADVYVDPAYPLSGDEVGYLTESDALDLRGAASFLAAVDASDVRRQLSGTRVGRPGARP